MRDAFVFFGATGDLAYKKIFPSLQAMIKRGHLNVHRSKQGRTNEILGTFVFNPPKEKTCVLGLPLITVDLI